MIIEAMGSRRISFAERACQGEPADKHSLKRLIFAMLGSVERSVVLLQSER
jgi:hypothetical protein